MKDVWSQVKIKGAQPKQTLAPQQPEAENTAAVHEPPAEQDTHVAIVAGEPSCWRCPVCAAPLNLAGRTLRCVKRHSFDMAKEGYINLLLANKKNSAEPGDSKEMLQGRRAFLERDFYAPLADKLAGLIGQTFANDTPLRIVDAGCGEGYYLGRLAQQLSAAHEFIGTDISRNAMRMAGKRYPEMQFAVASSYDLPLADNSVDVLLRVFAPVAETEVARVLKPGGLYLWAHPGEQHLYGLRELIYDQPQPHSVADDQPTTAELTHQTQETVSFALQLPDSAAVNGLLSMTPYYWTASKEKQQACAALPKLELTADFRVSVLRKVNSVN